MPTNNRIFYATQLINLNPQNSDGTLRAGGSNPDYYTPRGVQSVGITTNFNLTEVFSIGQLEVYDQPEDLPDIEVTMNKVIDGTPLLYHLAMCGNNPVAGAVDKTLTEVGNNRVNFRLGIYADNSTAAVGTPDSYIECSGMYLSSFTYTLGVDDNFTEDVTFVGNSKVWSDTGADFVEGAGDNTQVFSGTGRSAPHVARRMNIDYQNSTFPEGSGGINRPGSTKGGAATDGDNPYYQSVTLSSDLGREEIRTLGRFDPYYRYISFPTEVTSEFEVVASEGDFLDASDFAGADACASTFTQLEEKTIEIKVCAPADLEDSSGGTHATSDLTFKLGDKNKITSVNYGGGDAGGDNVNITYSFRNFNSFKIAANGSFTDVGYCRSTGGTAPSA